MCRRDELKKENATLQHDEPKESTVFRVFILLYLECRCCGEFNECDRADGAAGIVEEGE